MPTRGDSYRAARTACAEVGLCVPDVSLDAISPTVAMVVFARVWDQAVRDAAWGQPDYTPRAAQDYVSTVLEALGNPREVGIVTLASTVADQAMGRRVAADLYGHPRQRLAACEICGLEFYPSLRAGERFCSSGCRAKAWATDSVIPTRTGLDCGAPFWPKLNHPHSKYCSSLCRQRVHERRMRKKTHA